MIIIIIIPTMSLAHHLYEYLKDKASLAQLKKGVGLKEEVKALFLHLYMKGSETFFLLRRFKFSDDNGQFLVADGSPDGQLFYKLKTEAAPLKLAQGGEQSVVELVCGQDYRYQLSFS